MRRITTMIAALGVLGVVAAVGSASAHEDGYDDGWRRHEWQEHQWREQRWREHEWRERAWHAYAPPPVVYGPPGYYVPQSYYAPVPQAYYAPTPPPIYAAPGVSIGFSFR